MKREQLERLSKDQLVALAEMQAKNLLTVDGLWFMYVEDRWGTERATDVDADVWRRLGGTEAWRTKQVFGLGEGMAELVRAIQLSMFWSQFDFNLTQPSEDVVIFEQRRCLAQAGRLELNRGLFPCERVEYAYFSSFARVFTPSCSVRCLRIPTADDITDLCCRWELALENTSQG